MSVTSGRLIDSTRKGVTVETISCGFFTHVFQHFLALLSAVGLTITPTTPPDDYFALDSSPPVIVQAATPGLTVRQEPLVVRIVETQLNGAAGIGLALAGGADEITNAVIEVPAILRSAIRRGGIAALPAGAAAGAAGIVDAAEEGTTYLIQTVAAVLNQELALLGGGVIRPTPNLVTIADPETTPGGPLELVVRLPRALAVAGSDLVRAGAEASIIVVRAVARAVTDVLNVVARPPAAEFALAREEVPPPRSVPEALARVPITVTNGLVEAGGVLRQGTRQAAEDFNRVLRRPPLERALVGTDDLDNTLVRAGTNDVDKTAVTAGISAGSDNNPADKVDVVRPSRPRPVLGAVKAVTGTIKAVRDGIRTALGLPPRKPRPDQTAQRELAPAS
jgi:hypothetical protein